MTKRIVVLVLFTLIASSAFAADSLTPTNFLRAYVKMLVAERAGDHDAAVAALTPFVMINGREMTASSKEALSGRFSDSAVTATWAIVTDSPMRFAVSRRDRKEAIAALRESYGASITDGPKNSQRGLQLAAATLAWFLTQDLSATAPHQPRWPMPPRSPSMSH
jgi:hypothetical protein